MSAVSVYIWPGTAECVKLSGQAAGVLLADRPSTAQVLRVLPELVGVELVEHVNGDDWLASAGLTLPVEAT